MRMRDWSADVCSSDLGRLVGHVARRIIDRTVACSAKLKVSDCVAVELDAGDGGHWIDQSDGRHTDRLGIFDQRLHSISRLIALHDYMRLEQIAGSACLSGQFEVFWRKIGRAHV